MISILSEHTEERHPSILGPFGAWPSMEGEKEGGGSGTWASRFLSHWGLSGDSIRET